MNLMTDRAAGLVRLAGIALLVLAAAAAPAAAQGLSGDVEVHGFGGWAYGETDGNAYLVGTSDGKYDNADFALNISARPMENLSIVAQIRGEAGKGDDNFEMDYAFAAYTFSDRFTLRMGRVKHPFGLYGDIFDVGTLRPFYTLPQSIYGPNGYTARAYNGVGVGGRVELGGDWSLQYDAYGGQIEGDFTTPGLLTTKEDLFLEPKIDFGFTVNKTVGGRVRVMTPINGLSFGASGFRGDDTTDLDVGLTKNASREVMLASAEYLSPRWSIRSEWGSMKRGNDFEGKGGYLEAAFKVTEEWQLAARYDTFDVTLPSTDLAGLPPVFSQLLEHDELALGVNYWFSPGFVVRVSYQEVTGNRHAFLETPEQVLNMLTTGQLDDKTKLIVVGAQFSF